MSSRVRQNLQKRIQACIEDVFSNLSPNYFSDLPYLLATSSSESALRDAFAIKLRELLPENEYVVARELKRGDVAILGKTSIGNFDDMLVGLEIKMVAAPGNNFKEIKKRIQKLSIQLKSRSKKYPKARHFGLLAVRKLEEIAPNSSKVYNCAIKHRAKSLNPDYPDPGWKDIQTLAKKDNLKCVTSRSRTLDCGSHSQFKIKVEWMWSLFSYKTNLQH